MNRRLAVLAVGLVALTACGGDSTDEAVDPAPIGTEVADCPIETADVVTVIGKDVTDEPDSSSWRDAVTLVEVEVFGPGGNGFLDTWRDQLSASYGDVSELDGGVVGAGDADGQAYVETDQASFHVFVGGVECFTADQYAEAAVHLVDVLLGEPAEAVAPATCAPPTSGVAEATP